MTSNRITVFTEGDDLYADMLDAIGTAESSIDMESYIFEADEVGMRFIHAFAVRASAGIRVRLHLDAFGSMALRDSSGIKTLIDAGVELRWYNPLRWLRLVHFNRRNHRKLLIIDKRSVWLGGFNIHRENSLRVYGEQRWLDIQIRVDGTLAAQAQQYFDRLWEGRRDWSPSIDPATESRLVSNHNILQQHQLRRLLALKFFKAQKQIWLCTPYFMPDRFLQQQMVKAARRGIDVRLLLPYRTDRPVTQWVARATYTSLMASGVKIFEYEPRFIHAKMVVIDDNWCTVGSTNFDYRSFFINYEINMVSTCAVLVAQLQKIFEGDLTLSRSIDPRRWARRGWQQILYQGIGTALRRIL